jgi:two-component system, OmpR family, phosphate regulon sensor histidine kinase PhoR
MTKPIKKIGLFFIVIILLPLSIIAFHTLITLNQTERDIEEIYKNQLESILFSVNQYSDDIVRSWSVKIQSAIDEYNGNKDAIYKKLEKVFQDNSSIKYILISDSSLKSSFVLKKTSISQNDFALIPLLINNRQNILKLNKLKESGFVKIEPLQIDNTEGIQPLIFILDNNRICSIALNPTVFVKGNLLSKIQSIAGNEFIVSVDDSTRSQNIYSTEPVNYQDIKQKKNLWLIPQYSLGIISKEKTIEGLVKERTTTSLYFIINLGFLLIIVAWFGYRNIKREVNLAQIKSEFVSNVSHELRTPLALISMFSETLSMGRVKSEEKRNEYYNIIHNETERLSKIVNKILSFSKIEAGKWKYNFKQSDLNSIISDIYTNYKFHLKQKEFDFEFVPSNTELSINADPDAISEAVINLIDNAVKYSAEKRKIVLQTGIEEKRIFVEIKDSGIGISAHEQKRIFEKFYRVPNENIHNTKGTGLGLTLVKHIIEAHNGEIKLTSEPGKGSAFKIYFPSIKI